jgi:hypothetical protein
MHGMFRPLEEYVVFRHPIEFIVKIFFGIRLVPQIYLIF